MFDWEVELTLPTEHSEYAAAKAFGSIFTYVHFEFWNFDHVQHETSDIMSV